MRQPEWLARIDVPGHPAVGSGLLVDPRVIVTWAKVLRGFTSVQVTLLDGGGPRTAEVRSTAGVPAGDVAQSTGEIVVLQLDSAAACTPAKFAPYHALEIYAKVPLAVAGWPEKSDRPDRTTLVTADPTTGLSSVPLTPTAAHPDAAAVEFLGAPVYHPLTHRVLGLVADAGATRMVPTEELVGLWDLLADLVDFGQFGSTAYRELLEILRPVRLEPMRVSRLRSLLEPASTISGQASSVIALAEAVVLEAPGEPHEISGLLARLLHNIGGLERTSIGPLRSWTERHLWGLLPPAADSTPRQGAIVVQLAPTAGGDDETYELTVWTANQLGGELDRPVVVKSDLTRDQVQAEVENALPRALALIPSDVDLAFIEFVLAHDWLSERVDEWEARFDDRMPLGLSKPITVRDLDWVGVDLRELRRRVLAVRADTRGLGEIMQWRDCVSPPTEPRRFKAWLRRPDDLVVSLGLTGEWTQPDWIASAVRSGVPLMVWPRNACRPGDHHQHADCRGLKFRDELIGGLLDVTFDQAAGRLLQLRIAAITGDDDQHCGSDIALLRDDGQRRPMALELVPLDTTA